MDPSTQHRIWRRVETELAWVSAEVDGSSRCGQQRDASCSSESQPTATWGGGGYRLPHAIVRIFRDNTCLNNYATVDAITSYIVVDNQVFSL